MNPRFEAAWEIHTFLTAHTIPYVIIGGAALPRWGEPRFTKDVDLMAMASLVEGVEPLARLVLSKFPARRPDTLDLARVARVLTVRASNGCDLDISLGLPGFEEQVIERAVDYELEPGKVVRVCSAEDLIVYKCVAGRPQDLTDVDGIVIRQRDKLDTPYIRQWLRHYTDLASDPEIVERFERAWRSARRAALSQTRKTRTTNSKSFSTRRRK
jgi:hypothetical protein